MKKSFFFFFLILLISKAAVSGEPVPGAEIYVEQTNNEPIAFQRTGNDGTITFAHLDKGIYVIYAVLPKQTGKLVRDREKIKCDLQAGYHSEKKVYYLQEPQGFFNLSFEDLKKVKRIEPQYERQAGRGNPRIFIGEFEIENDGGQITLKTEALTPKEFEKSVEKARHDVALNAIRNMK